jgi:hypothetical protein
LFLEGSNNLRTILELWGGIVIKLDYGLMIETKNVDCFKFQCSSNKIDSKMKFIKINKKGSPQM